MRLKHMSRRTEASYLLHHALHPVLGQAAFSSTNPGHRVADEHVYHADAAEPSVHEDHPLGLLDATQRIQRGVISLFSEPVVNV